MLLNSKKLHEHNSMTAEIVSAFYELVKNNMYPIQCSRGIIWAESAFMLVFAVNIVNILQN